MAERGLPRSCSLLTKRLHRPLTFWASGCVNTISTSLLSGLPRLYLLTMRVNVITYAAGPGYAPSNNRGNASRLKLVEPAHHDTTHLLDLVSRYSARHIYL